MNQPGVARIGGLLNRQRGRLFEVAPGVVVLLQVLRLLAQGVGPRRRQDAVRVHVHVVDGIDQRCRALKIGFLPLLEPQNGHVQRQADGHQHKQGGELPHSILRMEAAID
jgi:hypothetical protein